MIEDRLAKRVKQVFGILNEYGLLWISRHELAGKLGRKQLNHLDVSALTLLEMTNQIEVERRPDPRPVNIVYYYRVNDSSPGKDSKES